MQSAGKMLEIEQQVFGASFLSQWLGVVKIKRSLGADCLIAAELIPVSEV